MKKLAPLMFTIMILGCGTETTVVEEPPPIVQEPPPIVQEPSPVVVSGEHFRIDIQPPQLVGGSVRAGEDNVDPERLNGAGIRFDFDEKLKMHKIDLLLDGTPLPWAGTGLSDRVTQTVTLTAVAGAEMQLDTEYVIKMYVQDLSCHSSRFEIRFRTMSVP